MFTVDDGVAAAATEVLADRRLDEILDVVSSVHDSVEPTVAPAAAEVVFAVVDTGRLTSEVCLVCEVSMEDEDVTAAATEVVADMTGIVELPLEVSSVQVSTDCPVAPAAAEVGFELLDVGKLVLGVSSVHVVFAENEYVGEAVTEMIIEGLGKDRALIVFSSVHVSVVSFGEAAGVMAVFFGETARALLVVGAQGVMVSGGIGMICVYPETIDPLSSV